MTTELTGAAKRLKECDFEWTSEKYRGGYRVTIHDNKNLVCVVVKPTFEDAANAALDIAEGKSSVDLIAENERLKAELQSANASLEKNRDLVRRFAEAVKLDIPLFTFNRVIEAVAAKADENERLKADLARVSAEFDLPPTIGPAPGSIAKIRKDYSKCLQENERLRARVAELEAMIKA